MEICKQQGEIKMRHLPARDTDLSVMGVRVGVANFFLHENCGRHRLGRFVDVKVGVEIFWVNR